MMDYYSATAEGYDELHGEEQKRKLKRILEVVTFTPEDIILDVGCGTGIATRELPGTLIGIDPALGLLKKAPFPVVCGSGDSLPFRDKSFTKVISLTAFHHVEDAKRGLEEMQRVCRGTVIITVLRRSKRAAELDTLIRHFLPLQTVLSDETDNIYIANSSR